MDEYLRKLQREAAVTSNYAKYDIALARLRQKRIVLRRLTIAEFAANCRTDPPRIYVTDWSNNNTFTVFIVGPSREVEAFDFDVDFDDIVGTSFKSHNRTGPGRSRFVRVLEVEHKTLITNQDWLVHPEPNPHKQDNTP